MDLAVLSKGLAGETGGESKLLNRGSTGAGVEIDRVCAGTSAEVGVGADLGVEVEADGNSAESDT